MVGMACMELVRTLRGSDDIVRMLRIVLALLRHVGTMGLFFTHYSLTTVNIQDSQPNLCPAPAKGTTASG